MLNYHHFINEDLQSPGFLSLNINKLLGVPFSDIQAICNILLDDYDGELLVRSIGDKAMDSLTPFFSPYIDFRIEHEWDDHEVIRKFQNVIDRLASIGVDVENCKEPSKQLYASFRIPLGKVEKLTFEVDDNEYRLIRHIRTNHDKMFGDAIPRYIKRAEDLSNIGLRWIKSQGNLVSLTYVQYDAIRSAAYGRSRISEFDWYNEDDSLDLLVKLKKPKYI